MSPNPLRTIIKSWKKSALYLGAANLALYFTYDHTVTNGIMKSSCRKAAALGDVKLHNSKSRLRHITVILNPAACKGKSKKLYTKWVEPILHLSGIKVSLIETSSPNQAYDLMKVMSNCDGVAIVGGDGTVHEALNGLLHRTDCTKAVKDFPVAIIPAGQYNSIARYIHQGNMHYRNQKEFLINATLRLIDSCQTKFDVVEVTPLNEELKKTSLPIYALRDIRYGIYQDNLYKVSGYAFYQSYIKPLWMRLQRALRSSNYPRPQIESVSYTEPCKGCSRCYNRHKLHNEQPEATTQSTGRRWWGLIGPLSMAANAGPSADEIREKEMAQRDNPRCGVWIKAGGEDNITDFRACMMGDLKVRLSLSRRGEYTASDVIEAQDIGLKVAQSLDEEMQSSSVSQSEPESGNDAQAASEEPSPASESEEKKTIQFLVDGQPTQAHSVIITALDQPITIFTGPYKMV